MPSKNPRDNEDARETEHSDLEGKKKTKISLDASFSPMKSSFERIWSEEDVVKLLQSLLFCQEEFGVDPSSSVDLIHRHICVNMNMEFSRSQVYEKIRRLKQKFEVTDLKMRGKSPGSIKPHDQEVYELSQKIWKPEVRANGKEEEEVEVPSACPFLSEAFSQIVKDNLRFGGNGIIERGFKLLDPLKAEALDQRWKAHCSEKMKFFMEDCQLKIELLQACIEALSSSG